MAIVRNLENGQFYRYHGNDVYSNVITGVGGVIKPELAQKHLRISAEATYLFEINPLVGEMVKRLKLVRESPK